MQQPDGHHDSAFSYTDLTSVTIPARVTSVGEEAFAGCTGLTEINVAEGNTVYVSENGVLFDQAKTTLLVYPAGKPESEYAFPESVTTIGASAFWCCDNLTDITIPSSVTAIGASAFYGCGGLTDITIPNSVTVIDNSAFAACSSLTGITIPSSVTIIGNDAFFGCSSLTSVKIPDSVISIGDSAFYGCESLTDITISNSVMNIGYGVFDGCSSLTSVTIPESVTNIPASAFNGCSSLTDVAIPNSVISIDDSAFFGCSALTDITIPYGVMNIGDFVFSYTGLTSISLPESVTSIGYRAFTGCAALTEIHVAEGNANYASEDGVLFDQAKTILLAYPEGKPEAEYVIPESVTSIGDSAFYGCDHLISMTLPDRIETVGSIAFWGCENLLDITVCNPSCEIMPGDALGLPELAYVHGYAGSTAESYANDCGYGFVDIENPVLPKLSGSCGEDVTWEYDRASRTLTISGSGAMEDYAGSLDGEGTLAPWFHGKQTYPGAEQKKCKFYIRSLVVEPGVTSLGSYAFVDCQALQNVTLPETVTRIGEGAFSSCYALASVTIPKSVTEIGKGAFSYCYALTVATISEGVRSIGDEAFFLCSGLEAVYFMGDAPKLGSGVFEEYASVETPELVGIRGLTLYYIAGKTGWTSPTWNGYPTATWSSENS